MVLEAATGVKTERRGARIGPDVRAPTAGFAQFDVVDPQRGPVLERRNLGDLRDAKDSANTFQLPLQGQQALGAASLHLAHHTTPEQATISNRVDDLGSFPQKIAGRKMTAEACLASLLMATERIAGRYPASHIASASAMSLCRLTNGFT